ncbi:unnamed protein product, partial [Mesorhabditis spiculigera]
MFLVFMLCLILAAAETRKDEYICSLCTGSGRQCVLENGQTSCGEPLLSRKKRNALIRPPGNNDKFLKNDDILASYRLFGCRYLSATIWKVPRMRRSRPTLRP